MLILRIIAVIVMIFTSIWGIYKLHKSKKFDKFCKDLESEECFTSTVNDSIKDIDQAKKNLNKQADKKIKDAKTLQQESKEVKDYLNKGGS